MRLGLPVAALALIICSAVSFPESVSSSCPTYLTNLVVDFVDASAHNVQSGQPVVITVDIIYNDGTPVALSPQTLSFILSGSNFKKALDNVPVTPTGNPGYYRFTINVSDDFPTGSLTVAVAHCCASDESGNYGPTEDTDSAITIRTDDNSRFDVGPSTPTSAPLQQLAYTFAQLIAKYAVPLVIIVLLELAAIVSALKLRARLRKEET